jgi:hypothetical protein
MDLTFEGDFLLVKVTAEDDYQTSLEFFTELKEACAEYKCHKILVISNSTPLDTLDAYNHAKIISEVGLTFSHRIAWMELNPEAREMDKFIENVLTNRAIIQIRLCSDEAEGRK